MIHHLRLPCGSVALVDSEDAPLLVGWSWYRQTRANGDPAYIVGDRTVSGRRERVILSRHVLGVTDERVVDHRNGDLLDNRKKNLRACSQAENLRNRKVSRTNRLGLKGVAEVKGRFQVTIGVNGRTKHIGCFGDPIAAARAYDRAAVEHFGEFARLNFQAHRDWLFPHEHAGTWPPPD
jgi:hypothetical protein